MRLDVYAAATPNGWKITVMLEELRAAGGALPEVNLRAVSLQGEQLSPAFMAISPNQKIPAIVHDGRAIMESCAILHYLGETFPGDLLPACDRSWTVIQWPHRQAANIGPVFGNKPSCTRCIDDASPERRAHPLTRFGKEAPRLLGVLDAQLARHAHLCGDAFTVADIATWCWVRSWKWAKIDIAGKPRIGAWARRVRARPGVERGTAFGVPRAEIDQFSEERKARYLRGDASIASNRALGDPA